MNGWMDAFVTQFKEFANRNNAIVINLFTCVDIEWGEAKKYMSKHNWGKKVQSICPKYGHEVKKMKCMCKWKKNTMPLKIGLAKDMKKLIKNLKNAWVYKKIFFFIPQNIFKFYLKFKKTTLLGERVICSVGWLFEFERPTNSGFLIISESVTACSDSLKKNQKQNP